MRRRLKIKMFNVFKKLSNLISAIFKFDDLVLPDDVDGAFHWGLESVASTPCPYDFKCLKRTRLNRLLSEAWHEGNRLALMGED